MGSPLLGGALSISHLFFADDSLLFYDATVSDCSNLKEVFRVYEEASGQKVNIDKSAVCFSPRTRGSVKVECGNVLSMAVVPCHERYLSLPTVTGKDKQSWFRGLSDRIWKRVNGWEGRLLSKAGKEVLIKAVAQSIPNYTMSVFQLPIGTCKEIDRCLARFWWSKSTGRGIHWRKWDKLCVPKCEGGMGFREIVGFNQALLAKQGWRLLMNPDSLVARMLKAKYFPRESFLSAGLGSSPSFLWRSFLWGRELLQDGLRRQIGNGLDTSVYMDPWVPGLDGFRVQPSGNVDLTLKVADLRTALGGWDEEKLQSLFTAHEVECILSIPVLHTHLADSVFWHYNKHGRYSVKSGYWVVKNVRTRGRNTVQLGEDVTQYWRHLWKLKIPPKMHHFLWRCSMGFIPCKEALVRKRITADSECFRCSNGQESPLHATWSCVAASAVLEKASFYSKLPPNQYMNFTHFFGDAMKKLTMEEVKLLVIILWGNWRERNEIFHGGMGTDHVTLFNRAMVSWFSLLEVQKSLGRCAQSNMLGVHNNSGRQVWNPPSLCSTKINCDGAVIRLGDLVGVGVIARNDLGEMVVAAGYKVELRLSPFAAELYAIKLALDLVVERRMSSVVIETDCMDAVRVINSGEEFLAAEGVVVNQIKGLMQLLQIPKIMHAPRGANMAAHEIAQFVARSGGRFQWFEIGPPWLMQVVANDLLETNSSTRDVRSVSSTQVVGIGNSTTRHSHIL